MWNAGVIGIHQHDKDCLPEVLGFTDSLVTKSDLHVLEQFAFSWVLTKKNSLSLLSGGPDRLLGSQEVCLVWCPLC